MSYHRILYPPIPARTRVGRNCAIAADLSADAFESDLIPSGTTIGVVDE
jgi:hypothetical protein